MAARCNYCQRPIVWGQTTPGGKPIPLDPEPHPEGNCELRGTTRGGGPIVKVLTDAERSNGAMFAGDRYMPHHATCPNYDPVRQARARRTDRSTSRAAAADAGQSIRETQETVLGLVSAFGPITDVELIARARQHGVRQSDSGLRTRRHELVEQGLIEAHGQKKIGRRFHTLWRTVTAD